MLEETLEKLERVEGIKKELEEQNLTLKRDKDDMFLQLQTEQDKLVDAEERIEQLLAQKGDFGEKMKELEERLQEEEGTNPDFLSKQNTPLTYPDKKFKRACKALETDN